MMTSERGALSQEEAARNQAFFREINERVGELQQRYEQLATGARWVCECADLSCTEMVEMTLDEYEDVRSNANRFVVRPDHVYEGVERVVESTDRFWLVGKIEQAAAVAAELDPRSS